MLDTKPPLPHFPDQCYLVGGAVRDWLSGQLAKDYDWLSPDPAQSAQDFAFAQGKSAFCMDRRSLGCQSLAARAETSYPSQSTGHLLSSQCLEQDAA